MIGGLVEEQNIGRPKQHARQRVAVALAARKHPDALEDLVVRKEEAAEQAAQLGLAAQGGGGHGGNIVDQAGLGVKRLVLVLREVVHLYVVPQTALAGGRGLRPRQQLDQG